VTWTHIVGSGRGDGIVETRQRDQYRQDMAAIRAQLDRMLLAVERGFERLEAQLKELIALVRPRAIREANGPRLIYRSKFSIVRQGNVHGVIHRPFRMGAALRVVVYSDADLQRQNSRMGQ
jgi:hypothetical protein